MFKIGSEKVNLTDFVQRIKEIKNFEVSLQNASEAELIYLSQLVGIRYQKDKNILIKKLKILQNQ